LSLPRVALTASTKAAMLAIRDGSSKDTCAFA